MSYADARANLIAIGQSDSAAALCSAEGRREFRRAVQAYSAAAAAEGRGGILHSEADEAQVLVTMGILSRVVKPGDIAELPESPRPILGAGAIGDAVMAPAHAAMARACPEAVTLYREIAALQALSQRAEGARSERQRQSLIRRLEAQQQRVAIASQRLGEKFDVPELGGGHGD